MPSERSDIDIVMKSFGCDEKTALSFIKGGINLNMLRDGIGSILDKELDLESTVKKAGDQLVDTVAETVAEFKQHVE